MTAERVGFVVEKVKSLLAKGSQNILRLEIEKKS